MIKEYLEVGQIVGTHGVRGEMRVNPWADGPEFMKQFKTLYYDNSGEKSVKVISARPHGNVVILKLDGIDTVEAASAMRNRVLFIKRDDAKIAKGSYFISELIEAFFDEIITAEISVCAVDHINNIEMSAESFSVNSFDKF